MSDSGHAPEPMSLSALIEYALQQGLRQVEAAGSPLHPFLVADDGTIALLFDPTGRADPMDMAMQAIRGEPKLAAARRIAVVLDTRITLQDRPKSDAILVLACQRDGGEGEAWAHFYRPKRWFRPFRREGESMQAGATKNLFDEALALA